MLDQKTLTKGGAEFLGTAVLASTIFAMIAAGASLFNVAIVAGLTLALLVLIVGPVSGCHVNPAVTLGLWSLKKVSGNVAVVYIVAQLLGGVAAWQLIEYLTDRTTQSIAVGTFDWRVFIAEALGTLVFLFAIAAGILRGYKGGALAATIGGGLFLGILIAAFASNGLLNPAVAIGVQSWSWTYALAPLVGGVLGMQLYASVFKPAEK